VQLFEPEPADLGGVAGSSEFASDLTAQEINQNVVILDAVVRIAEDAVEDPEQFPGLDDQARFLAGFADGGLA